MDTRRQFECRRCGYQFSVTARTHLHATNLSCASWLRGIAFALERNGRFTCKALQRVIGSSNRTAWRMRRRLGPFYPLLPPGSLDDRIDAMLALLLRDREACEPQGRRGSGSRGGRM